MKSTRKEKHKNIILTYTTTLYASGDKIKTPPYLYDQQMDFFLPSWTRPKDNTNVTVTIIRKLTQQLQRLAQPFP